MRMRLALAALSASLLLIGAGCASEPQKLADLNIPNSVTPSSNGVGINLNAEENVEADPDVNAQPDADAAAVMQASGDVDSSVDLIIKGVSDENEQQQEANDDVTEVGADSAELNAYGETSYEIK